MVAGDIISLEPLRCLEHCAVGIIGPIGKILPSPFPNLIGIHSLRMFALKAPIDANGGDMITGSCHCKSVTFEITSELQTFEHCHCHTCRKIHGTVYGSSAIVARNGFRVVEGQQNIREYASSPGKRRCFCSNCGSHVYAYLLDEPNTVLLRLGTLDQDPGIRPSRHIWFNEKAPWYDVLDDLPKAKTE